MKYPVGKDGIQTVKWAMITVHKWLPRRSEQIAGARAWGAEPDKHDGMDISTTLIDDLSEVGRTTNWWRHMPMRSKLVEALPLLPFENDHFFFANPLCVGLTEKIAKATVEPILARGAMVYVHSRGTLYRKGDDLGDMYDQLARDYKAAEMRKYRGNKS